MNLYGAGMSARSPMPRGGWGSAGPFAANPATLRAVARSQGRYAGTASRVLGTQMEQQRTRALQQWRSLGPQISARIGAYFDRGDYERALRLRQQYYRIGRRLSPDIQAPDFESPAPAGAAVPGDQPLPWK